MRRAEKRYADAMPCAHGPQAHSLTTTTCTTVLGTCCATPPHHHHLATPTIMLPRHRPARARAFRAHRRNPSHPPLLALLLLLLLLLLHSSCTRATMIERARAVCCVAACSVSYGPRVTVTVTCVGRGTCECECERVTDSKSCELRVESGESRVILNLKAKNNATR